MGEQNPRKTTKGKPKPRSPEAKQMTECSRAGGREAERGGQDRWVPGAGGGGGGDRGGVIELSEERV